MLLHVKGEEAIKLCNTFNFKDEPKNLESCTTPYMKEYDVA